METATPKVWTCTDCGSEIEDPEALHGCKLDNFDLRCMAAKKIGENLESFGMFFNPSKEFPGLTQAQGEQLHQEMGAIIQSIYKHMNIK